MKNDGNFQGEGKSNLFWKRVQYIVHSSDFWRVGKGSVALTLWKKLIWKKLACKMTRRFTMNSEHLSDKEEALKEKNALQQVMELGRMN